MGGITIALIAAAVLALAGAYWWLRRRLRPEPESHFRCRGCRHRLRYGAHSVGHRGICPRCRRQFTFPPAPQSSAGNGKD
jgi:hypothetical protein